MKKVLSFVVVLVLVLSFTFALAACHKTDKGGNEGGGSTTPTITQDNVNDFIDMIEEYNLKSRTVVAADFDVPVKMDYLDVDFNIEWTITGGNGLATLVDKNETTKTVKINKYADEETKFTLTAKASYNGLEAQVSKELTIEQYVIADWAFWAEKTKDETMNIKGVVVGKYPYSDSFKNTSVYLQDLDGVHGYFAYRLKVTSQEAYDTELAIGNIIEVNGKTSIYNDFREMGAGCTYSVVKNEDGSIATATPAVVNFDQVITESGKNAVAALDSYQGVIGTLSDYKVKTVEWYKGDATLPEGRLSVIFHAFKGDDELLVQFDTDYQATRDDVIAAVGKIQQGFVISVEAPLAWNKGPQMYPQVDKVTVTSTEVSAADKLATELAAIGFDANVKEAKSFDLAAKGATYEDVAFTWSLSESNVAAIADGKLNVTPVEGEVHSITVSLAATCGSETASKSFDIVVGDPSALTPAQIVAMAYALEKGKGMGFEVTLTGVISEIVTEYSAEHGNITVNLIIDGDEDHIIQAFRLKGEGDNNVATLGVGDSVTVKGIIKNYKGTVEFDAGCLAIAIERFERTDAQKIEEELAGLSLPSAVTESKSLDLAQAGTNYTDVKFAWEIVGETDAASIADGKLNLTVSESNETVTVKVTATIGEGEAAASASKEFEISLGDGISSWQSWNDKNAQKVEMTIKGVVVAKYTYNSSNKNTSVYLQDLGGEHGYFAYRLAVDSEEAYNNDLAIGNVITVSGTTSPYNGFREMGAGCTYEVVKNEDGSVAVSPIALINFDEVIANSADGSTAALDPFQGVKGTFTEWVVSKVTEVPDSNNANRKHYDFALTKGDNTLSVQFDTNYQSTADDVNAILQKLAVGYTVNVTAALAWNKGPQVYPQVDDVVVTSTEVSISDEDKIKTEKEDLNVTTWFFASTTEAIELATKGKTHEDVEIIWALEGDSAFALRENKLSVTIGEANATATLIATLKSGEIEDTKAFELQAIVDAATMTPAEIMAYLGTLPKGETTSLEFMLTGTVTEEKFENSDKYTNVTGTLDLGDPGKIEFFRITVAEGITKADIQPGRVITIKGPVKNYSGTIEFVAPAKVTGIEPTDAELLAADLEALSVIAATDKEEDIELPTEGEFGSHFVWSLTKPEGSESNTVLDNDNHLRIVPADETLTLTVEASLNQESDSKTFTIVVSGTVIPDGDKVAAELSALTLAKVEFVVDTNDIELPANGATYEDVVITWAITEGTIATVENGKLNVTIGAETATATLTATLKSGEVEETKEFTITAKVLTEEEIVAAIFEEIGTAASGTWYGGSNPILVKLTGTVSRILYGFNESNRTITLFVDVAGDRNMEAYKAVVDEALDGKLIGVGDEIIVSGYVKNYTNKSGVVTIEWDTNNGVAPQIIGHELSDANKVALEKAALSITTEYTEDINEVPLPSVGSLFEEDVTISWALAEESEDVLLEDNVLLAYVVEKTYSFDVVATISAGEATDTKSFTITMIGSASARINAAKEALTLEQVDFTESTTEPIALPAEDEANGVTITWSLGESTAIVLADNTLSVTIADDTDETVVLTALFTCGSVQDSKEFTLTAKGANAEQGGGSEETVREGSIDFTAQGYTNQQAIESASINEGEITISFSKGSNSNPPKYYSSGTAIRCYGGNTFTLTAANGYVIKSITLTFGGSDGSNAITADVGTLEGAAWTDEAGQAAVVFTIGGTSGNRRLVGIAVTYEKASA